MVRMAHEAMRILWALANNKDDGEKPAAEKGDGAGGRQHAGSPRLIYGLGTFFLSEVTKCLWSKNGETAAKCHFAKLRGKIAT